MSFLVSGLPVQQFEHLFGLSDEDLAARGVIRKTANAKPGFPCRVTLEDANDGERVLLLNYENHSTETPYRSAFAIYIRENAEEQAVYRDELPPVFKNRPIALRFFDREGMLVGADLDVAQDLKNKIETALERPEIEYIHAHNAMHGCFAAEIRRA